MRTGVMTMHRVINSGSFLQAWAMKHIIQSRGHLVIFVDFEMQDRERFNKLSPRSINARIQQASPILHRLLYLINREILAENAGLKMTPYRKRLATWQNVARFQINYRKKYLPQLGVSKERVLKPELDLLIIGSD